MKILIIHLYMDNMIYTKNSLGIFIKFKKDMMSKFEMTDLWLLYYFMGIKIVQDINKKLC